MRAIEAVVYAIRMIAQFSADLFFRHLDKLDTGSLTVVTPDGKVHVFGDNSSGEEATIELRRWSVFTNALRHGDIGLAEDYRDGKWETDNLTTLVSLALNNRRALDRFVNGNFISRTLSRFSYLLRLNTIHGSKKNIHAHYDLGNDFYQLWLDPSMTYSSALFTNAEETLEQAQRNKYDRILGYLDQSTGSLLEVGCGWGGFAERAQDKGDFGIKGVTLSEEQCDYARERLGSKAHIALEDYRHQEGRYDAIVSIEMFEAVGERYWPTYFGKIGSLLNKNGKAIIQTITMNEQDFPHYRRGGDFIRSYIFPGGMLPSPSRFREEARSAGLETRNGFFFGQDYARTLEHWLQDFEQKQAQVRALGFDDGFVRLWRFYLAACIAGFRTGRTSVMQVELSHA